MEVVLAVKQNYHYSQKLDYMAFRYTTNQFKVILMPEQITFNIIININKELFQNLICEYSSKIYQLENVIVIYI